VFHVEVAVAIPRASDFPMSTRAPAAPTMKPRAEKAIELFVRLCRRRSYPFRLRYARASAVLVYGVVSAEMEGALELSCAARTPSGSSRRSGADEPELAELLRLEPSSSTPEALADARRAPIGLLSNAARRVRVAGGLCARIAGTD
jgi:hypothetical protein